MSGHNILWRRVAGYFVDYIVIASFAVCLGLIVMSLRDVLGIWSIDTAFKGHLVGFFTLTIPALLYFSRTESSFKQASFGKRIFGLKVQNRQGKKPKFKQALIRSAILLFPWELAHVGIWYGAEKPFIDAPDLWALILMIMAQVMLAIFFMTALRSPNSAIHDKIAGLQVVSAYP